MESDRDPTRSRILTYGDAQYTWTQERGSAYGHVRIKFHSDTTCPSEKTKMYSSQFIPVDRPWQIAARWQINASTGDLILEISQVESGLHEAIVLSVVVLRSGHSLGDSSSEISLTNPIYFSQGLHF
jgi:hypothetical protein